MIKNTADWLGFAPFTVWVTHAFACFMISVADTIFLVQVLWLWHQRKS